MKYVEKSGFLESRIIVLLHIQMIFWGNDSARRNSILKLDTMPCFNRPSNLCSKHTEIQMTPRYIYLSSRTLLPGNKMLSLLFKIALQILEVG